MFGANETIHDILCRQASAGPILQRFDIDLCVRADETLAEACAMLQLSVEQVLERLDEAQLRDGKADAPDVRRYSLTRLIQHIVRVHHRYIREQLPGLIALGDKVLATYGERGPELSATMALLKNLHRDMLSHFEREEQFLFPYAAQLDDDPRLAYLPPGAGMRSMAEGVLLMGQEHESVAHLLEQLREQANGIALQDCGCATYALFRSGLRAFEQDLQRHLELENGTLFPRALELEIAANAGR